MKFLKSALSIISLTAACAINSAHATPIKLDTFDVKYKGFAKGSKPLELDYIRRSDNNSVITRARSGMFNFEITGSSTSWLPDGSTILTFCVELEQFIKTNGKAKYDLVKASDYSELDPSKVNLLENLISSISSFNFTAKQSATVQASVWEIVYETSDQLDLEHGAFTADERKGEFLTNNYLTAAKNYSGPKKYELFVIKNAHHQDQLVWKHVSAPSTIALLIFSMVLIGWMRRKA